ncbi:hypothetical protein KIN20_024625 [Parelaphostrongylus tenuis]|uniref:G-protein coupled receptors family 1 profile domain-containing protein n=1 Tax=Parelaphostrongylus tenuis TaxID=148309 RepID=A0AAD5NBA4_PARTN|nr:hypothetical protein KIN20_024625 [Parelaphostrongylus tenuis]
MVGKILGAVNIMLWKVCIYSHLAIALHRVLAISFPLKVAGLLTVKNTSFVVLVCWMLSFSHVIQYFFTTCFIFFNTVNWTWSASDECRDFISAFVDFYIPVPVVILIIVLDCITLIRLKVEDNEKKSQSPEGIRSNVAERKKREMEARIYKQVTH